MIHSWQDNRVISRLDHVMSWMIALVVTSGGKTQTWDAPLDDRTPLTFRRCDLSVLKNPPAEIKDHDQCDSWSSTFVLNYEAE